MFNAAKDRDNAKKAKDKAVADKDRAVKEKSEAVKAKALAEKQKADMERKAATSEATAASEIKKANTLKSEATAEMKKAKALYSQQSDLNYLYTQAVLDRDNYKVKADKVDELTEGLKGAYSSVGSIAQAVNALLYDPALIIEGLTPQQERLLKAIPNYAIGWAEKAGFSDIAEDIQKHYGISKGIQNQIDELTPKPPKRNKSYGHSL